MNNDIDLGYFPDDEMLREEDFEFDDDDMVRNHRLPLSKEQVLEAFTDLNISGQNWVMAQIRKL